MKHIAFSLGVIALSALPALAETTLRFASPAPAPAPINGVLQQWSNELSEASKGEINIEFTSGGVLGKEGQLYDRVQNGVVDMAWDLQVAYPGKFPATTVAELPGAFDQAGPASSALWTLYENGDLGDEYDDVQMLGLFTFATSTLISTKPFKNLDDLAGLKLSTATLMRQEVLQKLGAIPVGLPIYEWYQGMSRGVIDGVVETTSIVPAFNLHEVAEHFVKLPLGASTGFVFINRDKYESLTDEARSVLDEFTGKRLSRMLGTFWQGAADFGDSVVTDSGHSFTELSDADTTRMNKIAAPVIANWIRDTPNGQTIYDAFTSLANKN